MDTKTMICAWVVLCGMQACRALSSPRDGDDATQAICAGQVAHVRGATWVKAGAALTGLQAHLTCVLPNGYDPNATQPTSLTCQNGNYTLTYADNSNHTFSAQDLYFDRASVPHSDSNTLYTVVQSQSALGADGLAMDELMALQLMVRTEALQPGAVLQAVPPYPPDPTPTHDGNVYTTVGPARHGSVMPTLLQGNVLVDKADNTPGGTVALRIDSLGLQLDPRFPQTWQECPDHTLRVADADPNGRVSGNDVPLCAAGLAGDANGGFAQAQCQVSVGTQFVCTDANGVTTSTACCGTDPRWGACAAIKAAPLCQGSVVVAAGNSTQALCTVDAATQFTCSATAAHTGAQCCVADPRWHACGTTLNQPALPTP